MPDFRLHRQLLLCLSFYIYISSAIAASFAIGQVTSGRHILSGLIFAFMWPIAWPLIIVLGLAT